MSEEIKINGEDNIIVQNVSEGSTVNVTKILAKSYEYNDLLDNLKTRQELFDLQPEANTERRLQLSAEINHLKDFIKQFKRDVLLLAEQFNRIKINTDRLQRAKKYFDEGEFGEARAVLEIELEQMKDEQTLLLIKREEYETDTLPKLINNSVEFLILALSTQTDYTNPNRYQDTCNYFESSIKSHINKSNIFQYALFLQEHKQFTKAEKYYSQHLNNFTYQLSKDEKATTLNNLALLHSEQNKHEEALKEYEESLQIKRALVEANPNVYLHELAATLNNLAVLHRNKKKYEEALKQYEESLQIYRALAEAEPNIYLSYVATILNNLALLHEYQNQSEESLKEYGEALRIYRILAETNPNTHLHGVAVILQNMAVLHQNQNEYEQALKEYEEALQIYRTLAETNPNAYLPFLAMTSNNLANLHSEQNKYEEALKEYKESLQIKRALVEANPNVYLGDVATTLNNLAILHSHQKNYEEAFKEYEEALQIRRALTEAHPDIFMPFLAITLNDFADLHFDKNELEDALQKFEESTGIYRKLAVTDFQTYFPYLAGNLINLALFYKIKIPQKEKSIACAIEAMTMLLPSLEKVPFTQEYYISALNVLEDWGLSDKEIQQLIDEKIKETKENRP